MSEPHDAARALYAAKQIKAKIATLTDDEDAIRDTLEGETDLRGIVRTLLIKIAEAEADCASLTVLIAEYAARKSRIEASTETLRGLIDQAMEIAEWKTVTLDIATVSRKAVATKLQITDESQIPPRFWRIPNPVIDKKELLEALKNHQEIPGAALSNGGMTVSIRRA